MKDVVVAMMSMDSGLKISAFADTSGALKFCYTTTDSVVLGTCVQSFGTCKKTQKTFVFSF
jgi:hypothetical protein